MIKINIEKRTTESMHNDYNILLFLITNLQNLNNLTKIVLFANDVDISNITKIFNAKFRNIITYKYHKYNKKDFGHTIFINNLSIVNRILNDKIDDSYDFDITYGIKKYAGKKSRIRREKKRDKKESEFIKQNLGIEGADIRKENMERYMDRAVESSKYHKEKYQDLYQQSRKNISDSINSTSIEISDEIIPRGTKWLMMKKI